MRAVCSSARSLSTFSKLQTEVGIRAIWTDSGWESSQHRNTSKKFFCRLHIGPSAEGEHTSPQNTQWAIFLLLNICLVGWKIFVNPNTPCTFFCVKCLARSQQFTHTVPSLQGPCFPEHPLQKSPVIKKSHTACRCLTGCSHASPHLPRAPTGSTAMGWKAPSSQRHQHSKTRH